MLTVLIPETQTQNVLASARCLSRAGHRVFLASHLPLASWARSRCVSGVLACPDPVAGAEPFVRRVLGLVASIGADVLLPHGHDSTVAVSLFRSLVDISSVACPTPHYGVLRFGHDKWLTYQTCLKLGIPVPRTSLEPLEGLRGFRFPLVVKARKACGVAAGVRLVRGLGEFRVAFSEVGANRATDTSDYSPMVQDYVPGDVHDVVGLCSYGSVVCAVSQVRVEMFPLWGGVGGWNTTTDEPELVDLASRFLRYVRWHGPFQAEFKLGPDGYSLIELNPKLWGTMELAIRAGINVPEVALAVALGRSVGLSINGYRVGVSWMWPFPQGFRNLVVDPSLGRLARLFWRPIDLSDPGPDLWNIYYNARWLVGGARS